jgi:cytochrome c-type biogenesis protein CcmH/NrfG
MLLGDALAGQEKWGDARKAYDQALTNAPSVPDVLIAAARAARVTGDPERAQALARRALGVDPRDQRASALIAVPAAPK